MDSLIKNAIKNICLYLDNSQYKIQNNYVEKDGEDYIINSDVINEYINGNPNSGKLDFIATKDEVKCCVSFKGNGLSKSTLQAHINNTKDEHNLSNNDFIILIYNSGNNLDTYLKQNMNNIYVHLFTILSLQFNILEHEYVPKHTRLSKEEKDEIYLKYNISDDKQMPEISRFDPVANAIFLKPGEVCKIERYDKECFTSVYFRLCI
jgi:DNA-directed RNA polymerase subunit H (RpoH/RPB5)